MWTSDVDSSSWPSSPGSPGSPADASETGSATGRASRHGTRRQGGPRRVSARTRRRLVSSLRRLANRPAPHDAARRRFDVLLHNRVAPVRADLLEIATLLEDAAQPDPACVAALHRLLTDACESPLYNPDVHPSELRATLYHVRSRLTAPTPQPSQVMS